MKTKSFLFKLLHNKHKYLILLVTVCGSVGFLAGILIGKLIQIFPPVYPQIPNLIRKVLAC